MQVVLICAQYSSKENSCARFQPPPPPPPLAPLSLIVVAAPYQKNWPM